MKNYFCCTLALLLLSLTATHVPTPVTAAPPVALARADESFYASLTSLLQRHVQGGMVNYKTLQRDGKLLQDLVRKVAQYDLKGAAGTEKKAFYLNAYNVLVLQQVLEHYPLKSVMDVPGFFDSKRHEVAGEPLTLNELEQQKLLVPFQDARIHFALVCAARSCPPLLSNAYLPDQVEKQLEAQARQALQNPDFIRVQPGERQVLVSEIFRWYQQDFLREAPSVIAYINRYRKAALPKQYALGYYTYNWRLNEVQ